MSLIKSIKKLAIVIGEGDLPKIIIDSTKEQGIDFVVAGVRGSSSKLLYKKHPHFVFSLGQVEYFLDNLKKQNVSHICFAGSIFRPSLFSLMLDKTAKKLIEGNITSIKGDDSLFKVIIKFLEEKGFSVIASQSINPNILASKVKIGSYKNITDGQWQNIKHGFSVAKELGSLDVGQSVIAQQNMIIALEGVEGTAKLIKRSKALLKKKGERGVLIKVKKNNQTKAVDMPTIGDKTVKQIVKSNLAGILLEEGSTFILNKKLVEEISIKNNIFIITMSKEELESL